MAVPPIAALEIGTSRTVACVGEKEKNGRVRITGVGCCRTMGVRKGQIIDLEQARVGVEHAVRQAAAMSSVNIWQVQLAIAGGHIQAESNVGKIAIRARDRVVRQEDIANVRERAETIPIVSDRKILHTLDQTYTLDGQTGIADPKKLNGEMLAFSVLGIHCLKNHVNNAVSVAKSEKLEVVDVAFAGVCAAKAVLTEEQKQRGVALIDLGGGTTSYVAFADTVLATAGCVPVGGGHVTRDIAAAFNRLGLVRAEELKCKEGSATVFGADTESPRITVRRELTDLDEMQVNRRALNTVINARMDELLCLLRERLDKAGVLPHLGAGIVLTGGGAYLRNITGLASRVFGMSCSIGLPQNVDGLESEEQPAALATAAGLVTYGFDAYHDTGLFGIFRNLFKKGSKT